MTIGVTPAPAPLTVTATDAPPLADTVTAACLAPRDVGANVTWSVVDAPGASVDAARASIPN
jgi:hypothetical protein